VDRFHGRSYGLGIRLGPAKVPGEPLKKILNLLAFGQVLPLVLALIMPLVLFRIWRIRIVVLRHVNLLAAIVGEFAG
jgi:hypothetical protein